MTTYQPKKVDQNQAGIVAALRRVGVIVTCTHEIGRGYPDITCGVRGLTLVGDFDRAEVLRLLAGVEGLTIHPGANILMEIKNPAQRWRMTPAERRWHKIWRGQKAIVETVQQAFHLIGKF